MDFLQHCIHEWPDGILYGMDGANVEQCRELREDVALVRDLDAARKFVEYASNFEAKLDAYEARLKQS